MRYFYDTEFLEDGKTIELISIGLVADDGREYYAVNADAPWSRIEKDDWLLRNVMPSLPVSDSANFARWLAFPANTYPKPKFSPEPDLRDSSVRPSWVIANEVRDFLLAGATSPELWAWYAAYDHVALCQLWGRMIDLPKGIPMFTNDLKQRVSERGIELLPEQVTGEHNALSDAKHLRDMFKYVREVSGS